MPKTLKDFFTSASLARATADSAAGNGNQVSTLNIIQFVRKHGFQGVIEFIYPPEMQTKISDLFALPPSIPSNYFEPSLNISFIQYPKYVDALLAGTVQPAAFAFSGASCSSSPIYNYAVATAIQSAQYNLVNMARFTNADFFLCYSPFLAIESRNMAGYMEGLDNKIVLTNPDETVIQQGTGKKFIRAAYPSLDEVRGYLEQSARGQRTLVRNPALPMFMDYMEKKKVNVMNLYGYTIAFQHDHNPSNIFQILLGARQAQLSNVATFQKPLVLAVYYNYTHEINYLHDAIFRNHWAKSSSQIDNPWSFDSTNHDEAGLKKLQQLIHDMGLRDNFFTGHLYEHDVMQRISALQERQIFVLSMGSLPHPVMNGLFPYPTDFPPVREGANSLNLLAQTGLAHVRCMNSWEVGYELAEPELKTWLSSFYNKFCSSGNRHYKEWPEDYNVVSMLSTLIINAKNATSAVAKYFKRIQAEAVQPKDRIYIGFERGVELSQQRKQAPTFFAPPESHRIDGRHPEPIASNNINSDLNNFSTDLGAGSFVFVGLLALGLFKNCRRRKHKPAECNQRSHSSNKV
jgi:hypothetical protein